VAVGVAHEGGRVGGCRREGGRGGGKGVALGREVVEGNRREGEEGTPEVVARGRQRHPSRRWSLKGVDRVGGRWREVEEGCRREG
jgi:hypothetical protein